MSEQLTAIIAGEILARGPMTFARFMELALYHPELGYYSQGAGIGHDFHTSPELHPVFGALLARQAAQCWSLLEHPPVFQIVELGAGTGSLAAILLDSLRVDFPDCWRAVRYRIIEQSTALREQQQVRLAGLPVDWGGLPSEITGLVFSNEVFDALPVHLVEMQESGLAERYVGYGNGRFHEVAGPLSTPELEEYFAHTEIALPAGYRTEVCLAAKPLIQQIGEALIHGWVLTIDYGYPAEERYSPERATGTLTGYHGGSFGYDPFRWIGEQDLTAHVDFTALARWGAESGLATFGLVTQRSFLRNLGFDAYLHGLDTRGLDRETWEANRNMMMQVAAPGGLGRFGVLGQVAGSAPEELFGFGDNPVRRQLIAERARIRIPLLGGSDAPPTPDA